MRPEAGRAGEAYGAAAGEQPYQPLALLLAGQERQLGLGRSGRDRRSGRAGDLGAFGRTELLGTAGALARRAGLYLAAVDGVDGEQVVARDELHGAGERGRVLCEIGCEGIPRRTSAGRMGVTVVAVLLGLPAVRVHRFQAPQKRRVPDPAPPGLLHTALSLLVRARQREISGGRPNPKPSHSIYDSPGSRAVRDVTVS